ncbi:MAG: hypothetical protein AAF497_01780 [Planctomycetota bacterium]
MLKRPLSTLSVLNLPADVLTPVLLQLQAVAVLRLPHLLVTHVLQLQAVVFLPAVAVVAAAGSVAC